MKSKMTEKDASRIQSSVAKQNGGGVPKGSFAARAQAAAEKNTNEVGSKSMKQQ